MTKPKTADELRFCKISNGGCRAPAGYGISGVGTCDGDKGTQGTCYSCGEPVCGSPTCSKRANYYDYGRQRLCVDCLDDLRKPKPKKAVKQEPLTKDQILTELRLIDRHMRVDLQCWESPKCPCCALSALITRLEVEAKILFPTRRPGRFPEWR